MGLDLEFPWTNESRAQSNKSRNLIPPSLTHNSLASPKSQSSLNTFLQNWRGTSFSCHVAYRRASFHLKTWQNKRVELGHLDGLQKRRILTSACFEERCEKGGAYAPRLGATEHRSNSTMAGKWSWRARSRCSAASCWVSCVVCHVVGAFGRPESLFPVPSFGWTFKFGFGWLGVIPWASSIFLPEKGDDVILWILSALYFFYVI